MSRIVRVTGGFVLAALALGACGSDTAGIGGAQKANAQRADQICLDAQDKIGRAELGSDAAMQRDVIRDASDKLMALKAPSENENTWQLLIQNVNNLWISLDDVAQARDPNVNDQPRATRALTRIRDLNGLVMKYADQYGAKECANGFGGTRSRRSSS